MSASALKLQTLQPKVSRVTPAMNSITSSHDHCCPGGGGGQ